MLFYESLRVPRALDKINLASVEDRALGGTSSSAIEDR